MVAAATKADVQVVHVLTAVPHPLEVAMVNVVKADTLHVIIKTILALIKTAMKAVIVHVTQLLVKRGQATLKVATTIGMVSRAMHRGTELWGDMVDNKGLAIVLVTTKALTMETKAVVAIVLAITNKVMEAIAQMVVASIARGHLMAQAHHIADSRNGGEHMTHTQNIRKRKDLNIRRKTTILPYSCA